MSSQEPQQSQNSEIKFVYLESNKQKVALLVSSYNRQSLFTLIFSIFFAVYLFTTQVYQLQKHLAIFFKSNSEPDTVTREREMEYHSLNLHTFYAFMTFKVALLLVHKAWKIRKEPNFNQYDLETFRKQFTQIQDYIYFNLLLVCFSLVRYFEAGFLQIWFDFVGSIIGLFLGKLLQKYRQEILHYSTQLKQETID